MRPSLAQWHQNLRSNESQAKWLKEPYSRLEEKRAFLAFEWLDQHAPVAVKKNPLLQARMLFRILEAIRACDAIHLSQKAHTEKLQAEFSLLAEIEREIGKYQELHRYENTPKESDEKKSESQTEKETQKEPLQEIKASTTLRKVLPRPTKSIQIRKRPSAQATTTAQPQKDYYKILGLSSKASLSEIRSAYKKLARKWHPDKNKSDPEAEAMFKDINEAHEVLSDPERRAQYDQQYHASGMGVQRTPEHTLAIATNKQPSPTLKPENFLDLYKILGLAPTASPTQIKKAYVKLVLKVHPDKRPDFEQEQANEEFKVLDGTYKTLSNPELRSQYDVSYLEHYGLTAMPKAGLSIHQDHTAAPAA